MCRLLIFPEFKHSLGVSDLTVRFRTFVTPWIATGRKRGSSSPSTWVVRARVAWPKHRYGADIARSLVRGTGGRGD